VLTLRGATVLDVRDLAGLRSSPLPHTQGATQEFKTSGPYGWIRHPIYSGWFLMVLAANPMTMTRLTFALVSCAYLIVAIPLEEGTLRRTSVGAYDAYMRTVRWRVVPGLF
jgi:protein-S-isoprenylcysteine O-methyltransferase Ste14